MKERALVNKYFNSLITSNDGFISGYNKRDRPQVWLFNHCTTREYERYGVFYGNRVSDTGRLIIPIQPKVNWCDYFYYIQFVDVSGSFSLFRLASVHTLLVVNPFVGYTDCLLDVPLTIFSPNLFEVPHYLSITSDQADGFRIFYVNLVNDIPRFHVFDSRVGFWVVKNAYLLGEQVVGKLGGSGDLTYEFTIVDDDSLYSMLSWDGNLFYCVGDLLHDDSDDLDYELTWYYFGDWALNLMGSDYTYHKCGFELVACVK
ncbi:hypothetical protein CTI12_AA219970 [Artemisia annua]|uniref:F-box domain-containing protein n=1 Tax=Artemisia annua TaxID=35608 RepID=A0A2U1NWP5_ARTAN|nr:hypothetical protein CTI12_AA219970 [Artemisia annua]